MADATSALAAALGDGGRDGAGGGRSLRLIEMRGLELAQLGVYCGCEAAFAQAIEPILGAPLPATGSTPARGRASVYRIAADQYWVLSRDRALASHLAAAVAPEVGSVTSLSHGRVRLALEGPAARAALATLVPIDLHPAAFAVGDCAQTGAHHIAVLLERTDVDRYELTVLRSYARSLWELLADAALRYGYDTRTEGP
jgi:heterotetrameric sarcosine oxidase gamma subunit